MCIISVISDRKAEVSDDICVLPLLTPFFIGRSLMRNPGEQHGHTGPSPYFGGAVSFPQISLGGVKWSQIFLDQVIEDSSPQDRRGHWSPGSSPAFLTRYPHTPQPNCLDQGLWPGPVV